ncbi:conserved hypothetical protein [Streptomyces sp. SPB074]|nr:conserved hypothetical protein [Streptomyces sp. SPB074]
MAERADHLLLRLAHRALRAAHRTLAHRPGTLLTHRPGTLLTHRPGTLLTHRPGSLLAHRAGALLAHLPHGAGTLRAVAAGTGGELRGTGGQLGRTAHVLLLRMLLLARVLRLTGVLRLAGVLRLPRVLLPLRRTGYGGGPGTLRPFRLLGTLAHVLLLVLRGGTRGRGEFRAQVLVLACEPGQFGFHLVEEGIDLVLVIAFSEADGRELLVPHVLGGQWHLFTST